MTLPSRDKPNGASVLVCGAGVGGLMAALECWRRGFDVRIIEKTSENITTGDNFSIGPSAFTTFSHWPEMEKRRSELGYEMKVAIHSQCGERVKDPEEFVSETVSPEKRAMFLRYDRPEFHEMLLEQIAKIGLQVEYSRDAVDYHEDAEQRIAWVTLKDGTKVTADVVIAADGRRGRSWTLTTGHEVPFESTGTADFRVSYDINVAASDPIIAERFKEQDPVIAEAWLGKDIQAFFLRTKTKMMYNISHEDQGTAAESWNARITVDEVLKHVENVDGWPEVASRVIRLTPGGKVVDWRLMFRNPQPKWTSPAGLVVALGDAAHAFLPSSGNGATQAMEDAVSIAACLAIAGKDRIKDATYVHNLLRFERVSFLQAYGVGNLQARLIAQKNGVGKVMHKPMGNWIIGHDPEQYVKDNYKQALASINDGAPFKNNNTPSGVEYRPWTIDSLREDLVQGRPSVLDGDWS